MEELNLLIVEDDTIIGLDLKRRLNRMGIQSVRIFSDPSKAIHYLGDDHCDLVLMDIRLPGELDGIDAASMIKKQFRIPVVFVTGYADEETLSRARLAEPMGYILKPFKEHEIYATITIAVYKSQMDARLRSQQEMQSSILNNIQEAIITTDESGGIQYLNPKAMNLLQIDDFEQNRDLKNYSEELAELCRNLSGTELGQSQNWENHLLNIQGELRIVNLSISRISLTDSVGRIRGFLIVIHDNTQLKTMEAQVAYHETHDRLTGLINRSEFQTVLNTELDHYLEDTLPRSLVFIDINQFTLLNEMHGHLAGDELLKYIAQNLIKFFPRSIAISRLGDDEFALILQSESFEKNEENVREFMGFFNFQKFTSQEDQFPWSISTGMTHFSKETLNAHVLLSIAIDANIIAKEENTDYLTILSLEDEVFLKRRGELKWISIITEALETNRFMLYYQPILPIDPNTGLGNKVEVLIRMLNQDGKIIPPGEFIPAAERYNLMYLIDRWVLSTLLGNFPEALQKTGLDNPVFCVNLSGASLQSNTLMDFIMEEITVNEIDPKQICLEVTETSAISNMSNATELIKSLREYGCLFALDDFGNGFSNFNYLRYLEVDYLKIDGSFVKNMHRDPISRAMVEAIYNLAKSVHIQTIAEFVRNQEILEILGEIGVHYAQGYALAEPTPLLKRNVEDETIHSS